MIGRLRLTWGSSGCTRSTRMRERRLTPDGTSIEPIVYSATAATFSADGIMAAFAGKQDADPEQSALFVADVSGGPARQLTGWGPGTRNAIFSPTDECDRIRPDGRRGIQPLGHQARWVRRATAMVVDRDDRGAAHRGRRTAPGFCSSAGNDQTAASGSWTSAVRSMARSTWNRAIGSGPGGRQRRDERVKCPVPADEGQSGTAGDAIAAAISRAHASMSGQFRKSPCGSTPFAKGSIRTMRSGNVRGGASGSYLPKKTR